MKRINFFKEFQGSADSRAVVTTENAKKVYNLTSSPDIASKLVNNPKLHFVEEFHYSTGAVYKGQMLNEHGILLR